MTQLPIPYGPDEITPQWLTNALRSTGSIGDCEVVDVKFGPIGEGKGIVGSLSRLIPQYSNQNGQYPTTLVAKFPAIEPDVRARYGGLGFYEGEPLFYRELANKVSLTTPKCYYSDLSEDKINHIMLLEDLSQGRAGNSVEGCSEAEAYQAVKQLAELHAQWWDDESLEAYSWLPVLSGMDPNVMASYSEKSSIFLQRFESRLPSDVIRIVPELNQILEVATNRLSGSQVTLLHGDYQVENLIFDLPNKERPIAVIDWQFVSRGVGLRDLVLFAYSYGDTEDRLEIEGNLLELYHSTLIEKGVTDYEMAQCEIDFFTVMLWRLTRLVLVMGTSTIESVTGPRFSLVLDRVCNSVVEWDMFKKLGI